MSSTALSSIKNIPFSIEQTPSSYHGPHDLLPDFISYSSSLVHSAPPTLASLLLLKHAKRLSFVSSLSPECSFLRCLHVNSLCRSLRHEDGGGHSLDLRKAAAPWVPWSLGTVLPERDIVPLFIEQKKAALRKKNLLAFQVVDLGAVCSSC